METTENVWKNNVAVAEHVEPDKELWSFKYVPEDVLAQILHKQYPLPNFLTFWWFDMAYLSYIYYCL